MAENVAQVAVDRVAYHFDQAYTYRIPEALTSQVRRGMRVLVPFGSGSRSRLGVVLSLGEAEPDKRMKSIAAVLDKAPLLNEEMCDLAIWLKERTFCTLFEAARCVLPAGANLRLVVSYLAVPENGTPEAVEALSLAEKRIWEYLLGQRVFVPREKLLRELEMEETSQLPDELVKKRLAVRNCDAVRRVGDASVRMARLLPSEESVPKLTKKQQAVIDLLAGNGSASVREICYYTGVTPAVPGALEKKGLLEFYDNEIYRNPYQDKPEMPAPSEICLTAGQQRAYDALLAQYAAKAGGAALLYGVTGSGKTQVFLKLIDAVAAQGRGVIVMVPEISLTPQTLAIFHARYGERVAVFHSALSLGERMDEWKRVKNGEATIAVGTRSAVFAPFDDLGLVIMDEEQEHTYKSESSPRYHARDVARFRCARHRALLLLASATPSFESFTMARQGTYTLHILNERYGGAVLPRVRTVDLCAEQAAGVTGSLSRPLLAALQENLEQGRQSILLINRRGYHTFVACKSCGHVVTCPHCSISLTYHHANKRLMCHYCGYSEPYTEVCPECGTRDVRYAGTGTQRIEEELAALLPQARVLRMDADTTMARFAHEAGLSRFAKREYDILLGTQMVAKGLDFENVTLVGVVNADQQLYSDDYRSMERTFDLLTQVVGRAGRGGYRGSAMIQTMTPENPVIQLAARQDYDAFYEMEMKIRKALVYPPYCDICVVGFVGRDEAAVRAASKVFLEQMKALCTRKYEDQKLIVLGPMAPRVAKVSGKYRYRLIVKCRNQVRFRQMMAELLAVFPKDARFRTVTVFADMNPESIY